MRREFCEQQLANKKTARVLEAALGAELTESYMTQCMFDWDPQDDPPYFDGGMARLYRCAAASVQAAAVQRWLGLGCALGAGLAMARAVVPTMSPSPHLLLLRVLMHALLPATTHPPTTPQAL